MENNAVSLKLPSFWTAQPNVWFQQAEAQFAIRGVMSEQTKYYYVVGALDQETARHLIDFLEAPPVFDQYTAIKARLLHTFGLSRRDRAAQLLHLDGLGDRKPSALMDEMLALLGGHQPCLLFEQIFLEHMPEVIRLQLFEADFTDPRAVAARADALWQVQQNADGPNGMHTLTAVRNRPRREQASTRATGQTNPEWCFYHNAFGKDARKCQKPCKFSGNEQAGRQ